jgi:hypothetical protein
MVISFFFALRALGQSVVVSGRLATPGLLLSLFRGRHRFCSSTLLPREQVFLVWHHAQVFVVILVVILLRDSGQHVSAEGQWGLGTAGKPARHHRDMSGLHGGS